MECCICVLVLQFVHGDNDDDLVDDDDNGDSSCEKRL